MNVNIWGPELWSVLHGMSALVTKNNYRYANDVFTSLKVLLPCIHCRKSYIEFFDLTFNPENSLITKEKAIKWVYDLHNLVNDKLDTQLVSDTEEKSLIKELLQKKRPTLEVVHKRLDLSQGEVINVLSVKKSLLSFALQIDSCEDVSASFLHFSSKLYSFLIEYKNYSRLCDYLLVLSLVLETNISSREGVDCITLVFSEILILKNKTQLIQLKNLHKNELDLEWTIAKRTLKANCGINTCK